MAEHKKVKKRKITLKDWDEVAEFINKELSARKDNKFRKKHERIWTELDRQVYMEPGSRIKNNPDQSGDGRSAMELGELSRASEVLSADVRRLEFPQNKPWLEAHSELGIDNQLNEIAENSNEKKLQTRIDGGLRALMIQQHSDFGFKARHDLSIKESLHHGGYVAEVKMETIMGVSDGEKVNSKQSPVWVPHSMWNCYPDNAVNTTNMFYTGSMIIVSKPEYKSIKKWSGDGFMTATIRSLKLSDKAKVEVKTYYGDVSISRKEGNDIILPNSKIIVANRKVIYYKPNEFEFPQIIYNGYERLDVRDPYFISPLVKSSPTQKIASILANQLIDSIDGRVRPPVVFDGNDPDLAEHGGVLMEPGAQTPSKSLANFKTIVVGDPAAAQAGLEFMIGEVQKSTSVDSVRSGMSSSVEQTATEVERTRQGGQIRTVDFVEKDETHGLKPFLYMQHALNLKHLSNYPFYNPEMDAPDFERASKDDLPKSVHFEVVGSSGLLEEEQRQRQTMSVTQFLIGVKPEIVNIDLIAKEMYQDAGNKSAERFLNTTDKDKEIKQTIEQLQQQSQEQLQQVAQELQGQIKTLQEQVDRDKLQKERYDIDISTSKLRTREVEVEKQELEVDIATLKQAAQIEKSLHDAGEILDDGINQEVENRISKKEALDKDDR